MQPQRQMFEADVEQFHFWGRSLTHLELEDALGGWEPEDRQNV